MTKYKISQNKKSLLWEIKYKGFFKYCLYCDKKFFTSIDAMQYLSDVAGYERFLVEVIEDEY